MSRVYRIRVRESVSRTINSKDRVSTQRRNRPHALPDLSPHLVRWNCRGRIEAASLEGK
jgi:hypothetical protein